MKGIQDSVVQGNVAGRDYSESTTYITNTVQSDRVSCPSCATTGMITIYKCTSCGSGICDACRGNGYYCRICQNAFLMQQKSIVDKKKREHLNDLIIIIAGVSACLFMAMIGWLLI